jgi:hypothetical protein
MLSALTHHDKGRSTHELEVGAYVRNLTQPLCNISAVFIYPNSQAKNPPYILLGR